jgi:hypothetical protein
MARPGRRRRAAEPADQHLRDMERELRRSWLERQAQHGPQPGHGAAEDARGQPALTTSEQETAS